MKGSTRCDGWPLRMESICSTVVPSTDPASHPAQVWRRKKVGFAIPTTTPMTPLWLKTGCLRWGPRYSEESALYKGLRGHGASSFVAGFPDRSCPNNFSIWLLLTQVSGLFKGFWSHWLAAGLLGVQNFMELQWKYHQCFVMLWRWGRQHTLSPALIVFR